MTRVSADDIRGTTDESRNRDVDSWRVLVLTAILGGGFEVKEIKIPRIGGGSRVMAAAAGTVFLLWGAGTPKPSS